MLQYAAFHLGLHCLPKYSKTCLKRPLKNRQNTIAPAILLTCIKQLSVLKHILGAIFEWPLETGSTGEPDKTSRNKTSHAIFFTPRTKHPTKICHPGQNIPCCFCHPGHNIPCHFCHPGHNIPCHFCHPGQNIPYSDCFFRVSLICDLHLL